MKHTIPILILFISFNLSAQLPEIAQKWEKEYVVGKLESLIREEYFSYDYSKILSNQLRFEGDGWSTYIGVFGPKNRRIDFHLMASKQSDQLYSVTGKSKLGNNIRELKGTFKLKDVYKTSWLAYVITFEYELKEPGSREGDGSFVGIGAIAFMIEDDKPDIFWAASGDFREYNNMFVGIWKRYNSEVSRDCIFSFHPSGTHTKLPFRDHLYRAFSDEEECKCNFVFKDELRPYGWEDYQDNNISKTDWWNDPD